MTTVLCNNIIYYIIYHIISIILYVIYIYIYCIVLYIRCTVHTVCLLNT